MSDQTTDQSTTSEPKGMLGNLLSGKTPGVSNIEAAYSRAGATANHTPGSATKLGSQEQHGADQEAQGVGSDNFKERISDQRQEVCFFLSINASYSVFVVDEKGQLEKEICFDNLCSL